MQDQHPTLVSLEIGNNDVLGALSSNANPGDPRSHLDRRLRARSTTNCWTASPPFSRRVWRCSPCPDVTVIPVRIVRRRPTGACAGCLPRDSPAASSRSDREQQLRPCGGGARRQGGQHPDSLDQRPAPASLLAAQGAPGQVIDCSVDLDVVLPPEYANMRMRWWDSTPSSPRSRRPWLGYCRHERDPDRRRGPPAQSRRSRTLRRWRPADRSRSGRSSRWMGSTPPALAHRLLADSLASTINQRLRHQPPGAGLRHGGLPGALSPEREGTQGTGNGERERRSGERAWFHVIARRPIPRPTKQSGGPHSLFPVPCSPFPHILHA